MRNKRIKRKKLPDSFTSHCILRSSIPSRSGKAKCEVSEKSELSLLSNLSIEMESGRPQHGAHVDEAVARKRDDKRGACEDAN